MVDIDEKGSSIKYIDIIKDMYDGVVANVRTCRGIISDFSITIGLHKKICIESILICHSDR